MKREFRLEHGGNKMSSFTVRIIGENPTHKALHKPYVRIGDDVQEFFIADKDLELFAVNILKALNSKKLAK